jgi:DNA-binding response OmpR family regulator
MGTFRDLPLICSYQSWAVGNPHTPMNHGGHMAFSVLLLDYDNSQSHLIQSQLQDAGYNVLIAKPNSDKAELLRDHRPDIAVIAGDSPDAIAACVEIRKHTTLPLIVSTKKRELVNEMAAIRSGADDYMELNLDAPTLAMKARRMLGLRGVHPILESTDREIFMDVDRRIVTLHKKQLQLTRTEFEILRILLENSHRVVDRRELIDRIWGGWFGTDHVLEVHVSRLRRKLKDAGRDSLLSVRGVGYRL